MKRIALLFLLFAAVAATADIRLGGPTAPDGRTEVTADVPQDQRIKNIGSHADGLGMCVMSSIEMGARWQGLEQMRGLRDWCAKQPGGDYPSKVDRQLKEFCAAKGIPVPPYVQYEGRDAGDVVRSVLKTGRIACTTYAGRDGVRYRTRIAHMVCNVHADSGWACVLDNNDIGPDALLWMDPASFDARLNDFGGEGWVFYWLAPPPPPVPHN